jgi:multiple sugar transport system ATP-binding protein
LVLLVAQVIFENVYKSFPTSKAEQNVISDGDNQSKSQPNLNSVNVLRNINLTVQDGEFMVLVGQSGCGKSTLLRLLAGLETLSGGNIYIGDRFVQSLPPKARDIAMVFQNYALYPHLDVYNNIAFGLRRSQSRQASFRDKFLVEMTRKLPRKLRYISSKEREISKQVKSVAQLLQIESLLSRLPKELSGGQKQRVALGRAIARNPQVFLMDEPLSNLDAKLRTETRGQIVQLQKQLGITTIYVTHDQTEAMTMGDRIAIMHQGQIQQVAKPLEVYHHPANLFVAGFIGSPPMNFLPVEWIDNATLRHPQFKLTLPSSWSELWPQHSTRSLILGIRPQHLTVTDIKNSDFSVKVNSVEALGNETYIYSTLDQQTPLTISTFSDRVMTSGEMIALKINLDKIHLFDADTGKSLHNDSQE